MWTWLSSPWRGASPAGWQLRQRGELKTVQECRKAACAAAAFVAAVRAWRRFRGVICRHGGGREDAKARALGGAASADCGAWAAAQAKASARSARVAGMRRRLFSLRMLDRMFDRGHVVGFLARVHAERKSSGLIGRRRTRLPVAAKMALATAGATGGTPGSPTPVGLSVLGTI